MITMDTLLAHMNGELGDNGLQSEDLGPLEVSIDRKSVKSAGSEGDADGTGIFAPWLIVTILEDGKLELKHKEKLADDYSDPIVFDNYDDLEGWVYCQL